MVENRAFRTSKFIARNPILHQNANRTITLIDIPASIAHAQGTSCLIKSTEAQEEPFQATEPKTQKARDQVLARQGGFHCDAEYVKLISSALEIIQNAHHGPWALPRQNLDNTQQKDVAQSEQMIRRVDDALSRLFQSITMARKSFFKVCIEPGSFMRPAYSIATKSGLEHLSVEDDQLEDDETTSLYSETSEQWSLKPEILDNWDGSYCNPRSRAARLQIPSQTAASHAGKQTFHIPLRSSFLLASCNESSKFRNHITWCSQEYNFSKMFDFILLDPPWTNKSVKRRSAYNPSTNVRKLITGMDLTRYIQPNGLVGIWITNKSSIRNLVLGPGGIFERLNVALIEEWIWIKTTTKGVPVYPLDGVWRKPYEVLLLGRAPQSRLHVAQQLAEEQIVKRVIAGGPDFHSRKPCLKKLIEPYLPRGYQALEVFARYLVEGWTSWGDEVLKYNWEGYFEDGCEHKI